MNTFDELTKSSRAPFQQIQLPRTQPSLTSNIDKVAHSMAEQAQARAKERAEEMELTRLTGQMTAESAKMLKDLVSAATTLMEQMDERDKKTDESTKKQIKIAISSIAASVALAIISIILSVCSYVQDWNNTAVGDQWQAQVLTVLEQENQPYSALKRENQSLLQQVQNQEKRIADLEAVQRSTTHAKALKKIPH